MSERRSVHAERVVDAPAEKIFAVLANPRRHADFDGSGMVQGVAGTADRLGLGVEFQMNMRQGRDYHSVNTVVEYEQDRLLTWETVGRWRGRKVIGGQWWRYRLFPHGERTLIRHSYLWGRATLPLLTIWLPGFPRRMALTMPDTLDRLARMVENR
ncbi:hypothetical protein HQ32_04970 [Prauserella sp. Am3]|nr:hypothetical protein HQ32_04970 [Prauserella sp. Am3]